MARKSKHSELHTLHRKYIPANILIAIISVVALIAQLFMPFFDLRLQIDGAKLAPYLNEMNNSSTDGNTEFMESIEEAFEGVTLEIPVNIYPVKMLKAATGTEEDMEAFMGSFIGSNGAVEVLKDLIKPILKASINTAVENAINSSDLTPEQKEAIEGHKEELNSIIDALYDGSPEKIDEAKKTFVDVAKNIAKAEGDSLSAEQIQEVEDAFDSLIEQGMLEDGSFDIIEMLKNFDSASMGGSSDADTTSQAFSSLTLPIQYTSGSVDEAPSSADNPLAEIIELLENPGPFLLASLKDAGVEEETLKTVFLAIFIVTTGIPALFWGLLALSALLRCIRKNKRVRIWYVKLFCVWGGLFVLLGNVLVSLLPQLIPAGESAATILSIATAKFLGSGVVTGICWLLLSLLHTFYYRRIKKQIKQAKKEADFDADHLDVTERRAIARYAYNQSFENSSTDDDFNEEQDEDSKKGITRYNFQTQTSAQDNETEEDEEEVTSVKQDGITRYSIEELADNSSKGYTRYNFK